jgi:hypothetical protein
VKLVLVLALVACGSRAASRDVAPSMASPRPAPSGMHAGEVTEIAITDEGDAALTADTGDGLTLWPALDGSREPVLLDVEVSARQVAIGRRGHGYLAAAIDNAGGVTLLVLDARGGVTARAQLAPDPRAVQIVAVRGDVLVRREDHSIARVDAHGKILGRVVADASTQLATIAARHGAAVALQGNHLRWLALERGLAWGATLELHGRIVAPVALSPDHKRLAAIDAMLHTAVVIELAASTTTLAETPTRQTALGFIDNEHALVPVGSRRVWWRVDVPHDRDGDAVVHGQIAVGDHRVIAAEHAGLEIAELAGTKHLGYHRIAGELAATMPRAGDAVTVRTVMADDAVAGFGLDAALRDLGDHADAFQSDLGHFLTLDAGHAAVLAVRRDGVTIATPTADPVSGDNWPYRAYDPATHVLAAPAPGGFALYRYDPAHATIARTASFASKHAPIWVTDPKLAGVVAVAGDNLIETFYADKPPVSGFVLGTFQLVDRAGTVYSITGPHLVLTDGDTQKVLDVLPDPDANRRDDDDDAMRRRHRMRDDDDDDDDDDELAPSLAPTRHRFPILAVSADARWIAILDAHAIAVIDKAGTRRWTRAIDAVEMRWSPDDSRLIAMTPGGIVALDAASGAPVAAACGWRFGLTADPLPRTVLAAPLHCGP